MQKEKLSQKFYFICDEAALLALMIDSLLRTAKGKKPHTFVFVTHSVPNKQSEMETRRKHNNLERIIQKIHQQNNVKVSWVWACMKQKRSYWGKANPSVPKWVLEMAARKRVSRKKKTRQKGGLFPPLRLMMMAFKGVKKLQNIDKVISKKIVKHGGDLVKEETKKWIKKLNKRLFWIYFNLKHFALHPKNIFCLSAESWQEYCDGRRISTSSDWKQLHESTFEWQFENSSILEETETSSSHSGKVVD